MKIIKKQQEQQIKKITTNLSKPQQMKNQA
jgi:hypothetical protein